ncbi:hypothetical protein IWW34DRAFT_608742, partial [Fusarium oxysporum f. sp. albedinis]
LPQTLGDAVTVTHCIIRYIWINSLCIIQHGEDNKNQEVEAKKVGAAYERALLILSVTGCSGVTQSFIGIRKLSLEVDIQVHQVSWATWSGGTAQVFFRQRLAHTAIVSENSESWNFQKRLLATRTLHFLPYELLWECKCEYWCECMGVLTD